MRGFFYSIAILLLANFSLTAKPAMMDTTIIEILDDTLDQIYYHKDTFPEPTRLVYPNLTTVLGYVYFQQNVNLISVDLPKLNLTEDYLSISNNDDLTAFRAPILDTIYDHLYFYENDVLIDLDICALGHILPRDEYQIPYFALDDNSVHLDTSDVCFSEGPPENLTLSDTTALENEMPFQTIGILSADGNYAENYFTYYVSPDSWDYDAFIIVGDTLKANVTFDYETKDQYHVRVGVFNQLGEQLEKEYFINIIDVVELNIEVIEILDDTLDQLYYHQENFTQPTKLVFPNLTTVEGYAYFYQNVNLVSVELPLLNKTNDYVFLSGNLNLESWNAPVLDTVYSYVYASGNTSLTEFDVCALTHILPKDDYDFPYYYITDNTATVDTEPYCFTIEGPADLALSINTVEENLPTGTVIGTLSASGVYPINNFNFYLTDFGFDNDDFEIVGNELRTNSIFDYEIKSEYEISVGVFNQLGEELEANFIIQIEDVANEGFQIIEILDDTLDALYYHQEDFTQPTKLVFPNLTTVLDIAYFYQNMNLIAVDLPKLDFVGNYMFLSGNPVLDTMSCPSIDTIHNYLYAEGNLSLRELDICNLSHILATENFEESYYYIENNPLLDLATTCLEDTELGFTELDTLVQSSFLLAGNFTANTLDSVDYYFIDQNGDEVTEDENFLIIDDGLYLKKDISEYTQDQYNLSISAYRMDSDQNTTLNERLELPIQFELMDKDITSSLDDPLENDSIILYPNPFENSMNLIMDRRDALNVYSPSGKLMFSQDLRIGINNIDLSALPSGFYYLKTENGLFKSIVKL